LPTQLLRRSTILFFNLFLRHLRGRHVTRRGPAPRRSDTEDAETEQKGWQNAARHERLSEGAMRLERHRPDDEFIQFNNRRT
jgi:hypothetical protein